VLFLRFLFTFLTYYYLPLFSFSALFRIPSFFISLNFFLIHPLSFYILSILFFILLLYVFVLLSSAYSYPFVHNFHVCLFFFVISRFLGSLRAYLIPPLLPSLTALIPSLQVSSLCHHFGSLLYSLIWQSKCSPLRPNPSIC
jgi:hypothetical protein